jgi:hypothetical protein
MTIFFVPSKKGFNLFFPLCRLDPLRGAARQGMNQTWLRTLTECAPGVKRGIEGDFLSSCLVAWGLRLEASSSPWSPSLVTGHSTNLFLMAYVVNSALFFSFILSSIRDR